MCQGLSETYTAGHTIKRRKARKEESGRKKEYLKKKKKNKGSDELIKFLMVPVATTTGALSALPSGENGDKVVEQNIISVPHIKRSKKNDEMGI